MTTQATPQAAGATLHLGGDAYCTPDLQPLLVPIDQLHPFPGNARRGDQDAITSSVRDLGVWRAHVVQETTGHVLVGNHQLRALLDLGATHAPASYRECDDDTARAIAIRDNHTSDLGTYDQGDLLALYRATDQTTGLELAGLTSADLADLERALAAADYTPPVAAPTLAERFVVPPFTVLDARSGPWQERKRRWLALGIQSEVGRGVEVSPHPEAAESVTERVADVSEGTDLWDQARVALAAAVQAKGWRRRDLDEYLGTNGRAGHYLGRAQPEVPTPAQWTRLAEVLDLPADLHGPMTETRTRPGAITATGRGPRTLGAVQTNLDGEDAARYGRPDTRQLTPGGRGRNAAYTSKEGMREGRTLGQGLQAHRGPDGDLVYTETTAAGVSIFDPVLCELAYRWFTPPGGHVLDPFAGGSVRGIVAAALGLSYTGIELRPEQVAANQAQLSILDRITGRPHTAPAPADYTPELTPVETHGGVMVKRDDAWRIGRATGAKSRTMHRLLTSDTYDGILTGGSRVSPQIERAALVAAETGHPCRVHTGDGADTPETATARAAGADVRTHKPGRLTVIRARLAADAAENPTWLNVPFGMGMQPYVDDVAAQVANLPPDARLIVPVGSGATLAGILAGLDAAGDSRPVLGVVVGGNPDHLDTYAPTWRTRPGLTLVESPAAYTDHAPNTLGDLTLDPQYEAKCLPYVEAGDILWLVACRTSAETTPTPGSSPAAVTWHAGDSRTVLPTLAAPPADLLFSCPPYADLEVYSDDPADLSNMPYDEFLTAYRAIIAAALHRLRPDRYAVWVIGEVRDRRGLYRGLVPDTIRAFTDAGAALYNEAILVTPVGSLPIRAGRQFTAGRKLGKTHQNVLVFCKGDPRAAADACGTVDVSLPDVEEDPDA